MIKNQYFKHFYNFEKVYHESNNKFLSILCINVRSISSVDKFNKFKTLLVNFSKLPDIIAIQETWFRKELTQLYVIPGFESVHSCRNDGYGGTSLYINSQITFSVECCQSYNYVETINVKLTNFKMHNKPLQLISFYRSQKCSEHAFLTLLDDILSIHAKNPIIILGDANIDLLQTSCCEYNAIFQSYSCESVHNMITRPVSGKCIDHIFSNISESITVDSIECPLSDHNMLFCRVMKPVQTSKYFEKTKCYTDYSKAREFLETNLPHCFIPYTSDGLTNEVLSCIRRAIDLSTITSKNINEARFKLTPWINKDLQELILLKERLLVKRRKSRDKNNVEERLKRISKIIQYAVKFCRNNYFADNLLKVGNDPKKSWNFINNTMGRRKTENINVKNSQGEMVLHDHEKASMFNNYFLSSVEQLKLQIEIQSNDNINYFRTLNHPMHVFKIRNLSLQEVMNVIKDLKINKSAGNDNISSKLVKECVDVVCPILVEIYNKIINTSEFPENLKIHKVIPIPKVINAQTVDKYRPISVLSTIDKIFEKILFEKLMNYLEENNLLCKYQFGFRRGCGTEDAVVNVVQYICKGLDDGFNGVAGVFFDFTKAFDLVDHNIMLHKLQYYGVQGSELLLFKSYFSNRKQYVQINDSKSVMASVKCGVPQGSGLGPLLFSVYLNDLGNLGLVGRLCIFADDVSIFYPYKNDLILKTQIERDAALLVEFARLNRLKLNPNKTKLVRFRPHSANINHDFQLTIDTKTIDESHSVKYLGITLQSNMSWNMHIEEVKKKIAPAIGILYKLKWKLDESTKTMIFHSLIHSHIKYLAIAYAYNKNNNCFKSLQHFQNKALKIVFNLPATFSTNLLYTTVAKNILPIYGVFEYQALIFVYKCLHKIGHHTIDFNRNQRMFNTRNQLNLSTPLCRLEKTKQRIDYIGSKIYNDLPPHIKRIERMSLFKNKCKDYIHNRMELYIT